ncbi:MAG: hypothetical protein ACUVT7_01745 [Thermoplasmata archaeon]
MGKAEILQEIKTAEEKVRAMTSEAEERRRQLQAEGKRLALEKIDRAEAELRRQLDAELAEAHSRIDSRRRLLLEEGTKKATAFISVAHQRMGAAKEFVLSEFERAIDA